MAAAVALPVDDHVVVTDRSMTNRHLAVRWDDAGNLTSVIAVDHAREILPERASAAVLELAIDHPVEYDAWDLEAWTPANATAITTADGITVADDGPLVGTVRVDRSFGESTVAVTYSLRAGSPRLDIHIDVDWHEHEHLLSMLFPLDVRADTAACDVQFGSVRRPTHPTTSWDAAKFEVCAHRFVDVAEPDFGVAILNNGRYGHGVFGGQVRVSLLRAARYPDPDADQGRHVVDLALYPHGSGLADVVREAERFNTPVRAVRGTAAEIAAPVVSLTGTGVEIDAIKLADARGGDGGGDDLVVRLHEACGDRRHVMVRADRRIIAASRCNLLEEPTSGLEVGDGIAVLTLRPFELVTLRLTRAPKDYAPPLSQPAR